MAEENTPVTGGLPDESPASETVSPTPVDGQTPPQAPPRPQYTKFQRFIALLGAIFVIIVTLMYTYSIATGDIFFR